MDQPLFGEQRKQTQVTQYLVGLAVAIFSLFSLAIGVFFGIKQPRDFVLVITLLLILFSTGLLVRWWRDRDDAIHPKFKYLLGLLILSTILAGISVNVYAWQKPPLKQPECAGLYITQTRKCIPFNDGQQCPAGQCYQLDFTYYTIICMNCTAITPTDPPINKTQVVESDLEEKELDVSRYYEIELPVLRENIKIN